MLSHRAAAAVHGLRYFDLLEVTVPRYRVRPGIDVHVSRLERDEWSCVDGVPVTGVSRTLFDLAAVLPPQHVERAFNEALVQGLSDTLSVPALIRRYPARRGVRAIRPLLQADAHLATAPGTVRSTPRDGVVRVTWRQLHDEREALAADLRAILRVPARRRRVRARAAGP